MNRSYAWLNHRMGRTDKHTEMPVLSSQSQSQPVAVGRSWRVLQSPLGSVLSRTKTGSDAAMRLRLNGRAGETRTHDPLHPMQVRYQAAPRPEPRTDSKSRAARRGKGFLGKSIAVKAGPEHLITGQYPPLFAVSSRHLATACGWLRPLLGHVFGHTADAPISGGFETASPKSVLVPALLPPGGFRDLDLNGAAP